MRFSFSPTWHVTVSASDRFPSFLSIYSIWIQVGSGLWRLNAYNLRYDKSVLTSYGLWLAALAVSVAIPNSWLTWMLFNNQFLEWTGIGKLAVSRCGNINAWVSTNLIQQPKFRRLLPTPVLCCCYVITCVRAHSERSDVGLLCNCLQGC